MATKYAQTNDGYVRKGDSGNWNNSRDATFGTETNSTATNQQAAIQVGYHKGTYQLARTFLSFDLSSIEGTVSEATLYLYGRSTMAGFTDAAFFAVKSNHFTSLLDYNLVVQDLDAINGWDTSTGADGSGAGDQESNVTKYSDEFTSTWNQSGYNLITLNSAARADMPENATFCICLINSTYDLRDINPGAGTNKVANGMYYANYTGLTRDPKIVYTIQTGYGNTVSGMASGNISSISGIATADVGKVNGI